MIKINLLAADRPAVVAAPTAAPPSAAVAVKQPLAIGAALILLLSCSFIGWRYWVLDRDSRQLDTEIANAQQETVELQSVLAQVQRFEQQRVLLQQRVALIEQLRRDQTGPVHMLDQISRALPPLVWLTELRQTSVPNEVVIAGRCTTPTGLPDFVGNLEASGYFRKSIEILSSTSDPLPQGPGELVKFEIKALFEQPGAAATPDPAGKTGN